MSGTLGQGVDLKRPQALLDTRVDSKQIFYASVDHPLFNGQSLDDLIAVYERAVEPELSEPRYVFFDEIQYLREWEVQLKTIVDTHALIKATVSGSAAAALRLKSHESGAGRFTDFLLPPLTFFEYLQLVDGMHLVRETQLHDRPFFEATDIEALNQSFLHYLNYGGYPEVVLSPAIQADPARFIKSDIIDKVLLRDLPSLYGIRDIQELNQLFTTLAFNTANELSLEDLSTNSGVAKNTLKRYIEYLEAAFLIRIVHRIDRSAKRFKRARNFKVYLTNPSMRTALFAPVDEESDEVGALTETAVFAQWFHSESANLFYSRWKTGEVDVVKLGGNLKPVWAVEVKWSDRYATRPADLKSLISFCRKNSLTRGWATSKTVRTSQRVGGVEIQFIPASVYCFVLGYNIIHEKKKDTAD